MNVNNDRQKLIQETIDRMIKEGIETAMARDIYLHVLFKFPEKSEELKFTGPKQVGKLLNSMPIKFYKSFDTVPKIYLLK